MSTPTPADAELILRLYEIRREPLHREARTWFLTEYEPRPWNEMKTEYMKGSKEDRYIRMVTSYWDMVGAFVNSGVLNVDLFCETNGEDVQVWNKVKVWIEGARRDRRPTYLRDLELLATRHLAWREKHWNALPHEKAPRKGKARGAKR